MLGIGAELVNPDRLGYRWRRARNKSGIDTKWRLHDLRHWSATTAIGQGHDVRTVAGRLGHSDASMTLRTDGHAFATADEAIAKGPGVPGRERNVMRRPVVGSYAGGHASDARSAA